MEHLYWIDRPVLHEPRMVLGFTGWMDGGHVSTRTIDLLAQATDAEPLAQIDPLEFFILNFPVTTIPLTILSDGEHTVVRSVSPMEQAAIFRPHTEITDGVVRTLDFSRNQFMFSQSARLTLFYGNEPHIRWRTYAECIFEVVEEYGTRELYFVGSVSSAIPHTREPRLRMGVSAEELKETHRGLDVQYTNYEGPASFVTLLLTECARRDLEMRSLVVEVPHYPFLEMSSYPHSILVVATVLSRLLDLELPLGDLRAATADARRQLDEVMHENRDFQELVRRLEEAYDAEQANIDEEVLKRLLRQIDLRGPDGPGGE